MILVKNEDGSYTEQGENTFASNAVDGLKLMFLKQNEFASSGAAFWGAIEHSALSAIGSSYMARKRQAEGKAPIAKVFF